MDSVTPAAEAANPFEGLEEAFAADQAEERIEFTMMDRPAFVVLRPMDADSYARFQSRGQTVTIDTATKSVGSAKVDVDRAIQELELLLGTVSDFGFPKKGIARTGDPIVTMNLGSTMSRQQKEQVFRSLSQPFRSRLVEECRRVNHMDPLGRDAGTDESKDSSS